MSSVKLNTSPFTMRTLLLFLSITLLSFTTFNNELDNANGFEKFKFGLSPSSFQNLSLEIDEGNTKLYSVNEPIKVNNAEMEYVRLTFCKNQLSAISMATRNGSASKLMTYLSNNFGPAKAVKKNSEWTSKKVYVIYEPTISGKDAIVSFYSNEICKSAKK